MVNNDNYSKLYNAMVKSGYNAAELGGSVENFRNGMQNADTRKGFYDWVSQNERNGFRIGDYDSYEARLAPEKQKEDVLPELYIGLNRERGYLDGVNAKDDGMKIFDVTGNRVDKIEKPGIYTFNGKKLRVTDATTEDVVAVNELAAQRATKEAELKAERDNLAKMLEETRAKAKERRAQLYSNAGAFQFGMAPITLNQAVEQNDAEMIKYQATENQLNQAIRELDRKINEKDVGFWTGVADATLRNPDFYTMGLSGMSDARAMLNLSEKGINTETDEMLADATLTNSLLQENADRGFLYRAGNIFGHSIPFMVQMAATGGFSGVNLGLKAGKEAAEEAVKSGIKKAIGATVDDLIEAALVANTAGGGSTLANILNRKAGQLGVDEYGYYSFDDKDGWIKAVLKGEMSSILEIYTEKLGNHFDGKMSVSKGLEKGLEKMGAKNISKALLAAKNSDIVKGATTVMRQFGMNGVLPEIMEEEANIILNSLLVGDNKLSDLFDPQTQLDLIGGMFLSVGTMQAIPGVIGSVGYVKNKRSLEKSDNNARDVFGEKWDEMKAAIDNASNEEIAAVIGLYETIGDEKKKEAVLDYYKRTMIMRGYNIGSTKREAGVPGAEEAYQQGYEAEDENLNGVEMTYRHLLQKVQSAMPNEIEALNNDPVEALQRIKENYSEADVIVATEYVNAKAKRDGVFDRVRDDLNERLEESDKIVESRKSKTDGMIHPATMKNGKKVYVVSGNVVAFEDGTVNGTASDKSIIVRDAQTGEVEFTAPEFIGSVGGTINTTEEMAQARLEIQNSFVKQKADLIDGALPFNVNDVYRVLDDNGLHEITIVADNGNGEVQVMYDGKEAVLPKEAIQEGFNKAKLAEMDAMEAERKSAEVATQAPAQTETTQPQVELTPKQKREEVAKRIPMKGKERAWTEAEPTDVVEYISLLTTDVAKQQTTVDKYIAEIKAKQEKVDAISALEMDEDIAFWENVKQMLAEKAKPVETAPAESSVVEQPVEVTEQPVAEVAPVVESAPVEGVSETPRTVSQVSDQVSDQVAEGGNAPGQSGAVDNNNANALQNGNNELNLQKENESDNEQNQNDIPVGGQVPQSVPQGEHGTQASQVSGAQETAARLRERIESAQGDSKSGLREVENRVTREFAQENGLWIEDESKLGVPFPSGDEHNNYIDAENQVVYKVNNRMHTPSILDLLDRIEQHNKYFPDSKYSLVGFTSVSKNGDVMPVFAQGFVPDARMATIDEIDSYMGTLGFTRVGDGRYSNGEVVIKDLKPRNVLADADGDIYVVDAEFEQEKQFTQSVGEQVQAAEAEVNTTPTDAQKEAGNYKKGHVKIGPFNISIEQPKGSVRSGVDKDGKKWEVEMQNTYGYFRGTEGVDGDHIDVFLSNDIDGWNGRQVFVVDQRNADGSFDEHKVMLGFNDINDAEAAYMSNYEEGWQGLGAITGVSIEEFEKWLSSSHRKTKAFAEYKNVKTDEGQSTSAESGVLLSDEVANAGPVNMDTLQLNMSDEDFNALLNGGDKTAISEYLAELDGLLRVGVGSPLDGQEALREEYRKAVEQYGKENIPAEVMDDLNSRMQPYSDLSRAIFDRKYALQDKLREIEASEAQANEQAEKEAKAEHKQTAFGGFLAGKTDLGAGSAEKALSKKYNFDGKVMTVAEFVEDAVGNGNVKLSAIEEPKYKGASRAAWNRMDARQQEADAKRVKESGTKTVYTVNDHDLGKTAYDYAKFLQEKSTSETKPKEKIEDVGEVLAGARKDELKIIASSFENATVKSLIELPFSKAFKKPDLKKAVESGALREEDALFYEAMFNALINSSKPKNSTRHRNAIEKWAEETYNSLQLIKSFVEADEAARDRTMADALADKFPTREEELAVIEQRKVWNARNNAEWGEKTTPNPVWVTHEVLKALGYKPGDKVEIPFGVLKANVFATGYEFYNKKGERLIMQAVPTVEEGIERIVWLSKIKRGDADTMHPVSSFFATPTKRDMGDSGRYYVLYGTVRNPKRSEFDSKEEADAFAANHKEAAVYPIREVVKRYGYKIAFRNPLTGDKFYVNDMEFETEGEALQYIEENYDAVNEQTNELLAKERGESKKEVSADDLLEVAMVHGKEGWKYAVNIKGKYANNMGMPLSLREFDTREDAKAFLNESKNEVFEIYKKQQAEQKKFVFFDTGENSRIGEDYRGGRDVTAQDFMDTFGFRGVQFGNWTNQEDRQMAVNQAYDAFLDLAKLLGVSPKALSLNGELGMAFGSRGSGFGNAHYELGEVVINLTKTRGAGSLAHEWWHALDNYFARRANVPMGMVTDSRSIDMRPELRQAYNELLKMIEESDFYKRSKARGDYWGRMHEVTARLMAEWVDQSLKDKGELNTFLSRGVNEEKYKRMNYDTHRAVSLIKGKEPMSYEEFEKTPEALAGFPYPTREELKEFGDAMRNIFDTVEEQETEEGNVVLYRGDEDVPRLNKHRVEKTFGGIWIEDKEEFAKFVSAVNNYAFEENGQGIAYTDDFFYAYYLNIDGQVIPYASVKLTAEQSQEVVNQVNQEIENVTKGERAQFYFDRAYARARNAKGQNNADNGNNNGTPSSRSYGGLVRGVLRKGAYYDNPGLYVKAQRADRFGTINREGSGPLTDREVVMESDVYSKALGKPRYYGKKQREYVARQRKRMADKARQVAENLNLDNVEVLESTEGLTGKKATSKGWFDPKTGKITVVVPNHGSTGDIVETVLHEAVAHYGLRKLFGENFNNFLDNVYRNVTPEIRAEITELAKVHGWDFRVATEEYLASLAENTNFERVNPSVWSNIKSFFMKMLSKVGITLDEPLGDNELRYILWRSHQNLINPGWFNVFGQAEDIAKQYELGVGNYSSEKAEGENGDVAAEDDIRFREGDPEVLQRKMAAENYERRVASGWYQTQEALQDSMLALKVAMQEISGTEFIEDVPDAMNAYLGENALASINKAEADAMAFYMFKPLYAEVARVAPTEDEREVLKDYLFAKHGLERNEKMAAAAAKEAIENGSEKSYEELYEEFRDKDFAGLTALMEEKNVKLAEVAARRFVEQYEAEHKTKELWDKIGAVNKAILSKQYECGLLSKDTYDKISGMYEFYIPLRGFDEKTSEEAYAYLNSKNSAFNAPIKKAMGRKSKADDPFANMEAMAESGIMQGNRNKYVKQRFLNLALKNPSDLVSISDLWLKYNKVTKSWEPVFPEGLDMNDSPDVVQRKLVEFEERMTDLAKEEPRLYAKGRDAVNIPYRVVEKSDLHQHQVVVKSGGRAYVLTVNGNPRLAQALNGWTNPDSGVRGVIGSLLRKAESLNRWMAEAYTTKNPDFIISNFIRDALYSNSMVWVKESPKYAWLFNRYFLELNPAKMKGLFKKYRMGTLNMNDETEALFMQFVMNGGETGFSNMRSMEQRKEDIRKIISKAGNEEAPYEVLKANLEDLNRAVENCARFAAFMTSRKMGRSIGRSVYDAKEISVNFNKKGSGDIFLGAEGQTMAGNFAAGISGVGRAGYVFWNAAIQGSTNFGRQFKRHPAKAIGAMATMFLLGAIAAYMGGDDDEDDKNAYYNLPESVRRSNLMLRAGDQWVSLPLPIEYKAVYGLGELLASTMSGKERYSGGELAEQIAGQITQILPIDFMGGGGAKSFIPTFAKPLVDVANNESWYGLPIYKENMFNEDMPDWTKAYKGANKHLVNIAAAINGATGGDKYEKGWIDINPAKVEYLLDQYFGGYYKTVDKLVKTGEMIMGEREYDPANIPMLNRVVKAGDDRTEYRKVNNDFYKAKKEHDSLIKRLRKYENDTDNGIFDFAEKIDFLYNSPEYMRYEIFEDYRKDIEFLEKEKKFETDENMIKLIDAELNQMKKEMLQEMEFTYKN